MTRPPAPSSFSAKAADEWRTATARKKKRATLEFQDIIVSLSFSNSKGDSISDVSCMAWGCYFNNGESELGNTTVYTVD